MFDRALSKTVPSAPEARTSPCFLFVSLVAPFSEPLLPLGQIEGPTADKTFSPQPILSHRHKSKLDAWHTEIDDMLLVSGRMKLKVANLQGPLLVWTSGRETLLKVASRCAGEASWQSGNNSKYWAFLMNCRKIPQKTRSLNLHVWMSCYKSDTTEWLSTAPCYKYLLWFKGCWHCISLSPLKPKSNWSQE